MREPARQQQALVEQRAVGVCYYCFALLYNRWDFQRDHFPVPRSVGGTATVMACQQCHNLKDRLSISDGWELFQEAGKLATDGAWRTWADFVASFEDRSPEVACRTARRMWSVWPTGWRITAGRMLGDLYRAEIHREDA